MDFYTVEQIITKYKILQGKMENLVSCVQASLAMNIMTEDELIQRETEAVN